jgi:hypothetical protein
VVTDAPEAQETADEVARAVERVGSLADWLLLGSLQGVAKMSTGNAMLLGQDVKRILSRLAVLEEERRLDGGGRKQGVGIGMVIAAALVADDDPVKAEEILQAVNMTTAAKMRAKGVDDYDIGKLKTVIQDIANRERNTARARLQARKGEA